MTEPQATQNRTSQNPWAQLDQVCRELSEFSGRKTKIHWTKLRKLRELLDQIEHERSGSIIEEEAEALLAEFSHDYTNAAEYRIRELEMTLKLYRSLIGEKDQKIIEFCLQGRLPCDIHKKASVLHYLLINS